MREFTRLISEASRLLSILVIALIFAVAIALVAWYRFDGSLSATMQYVRGTPIFFQEAEFNYTGNLNEIQEFETFLHNNSSEAIRVIGAQSNWGCAGVVSELPMTIPPKSRAKIILGVRPDKPGIAQHRILLFTNCARSQTISISLRGEVAPSKD